MAEPTGHGLEPRAWQGIVYRPCQAGAVEVRRLFNFAGAWPPVPSPGEFGWEAAVEGRLVGGVVVERHGAEGFVDGPVVVDPPRGVEALDVAAQFFGPLLDQASQLGMKALYGRPQGLDRLWVRFGFVPLPEASLPGALRNRPGTGLYAWRRPGTYAVATPESTAERQERRRGRR